MSKELKTYDLPVDHGDFTSAVELFYLKSEADAVIAELKENHKTTDKVYVVIEFDRETHEFSEIEGVFQSKEEAEDFTKDCNAKYLRYSYEWFEETLA